VSNAFYAFVRGLVAIVCRLLFRLEIEGKDRIPATGSFVLAPVHRSNVDFAIAACTTRRRMRFMAKDSLWKVPLLGPFVAALGAYPVKRGTADREALRRTLDVIAAGEPVVVFPEGTRRAGPVIEDLFEGPAYVASRAGIPIVPVGIGGSEAAMPKGSKMIRPVKVHVIVGEPLWPETPAEGARASRRSIHQLTERLHKELQQLFDAAQARVR
jgi:1-acyl-sn-glycerol-3-phosphate acyltransferase